MGPSPEQGLHVFRRVQAQARDFEQPTSTQKRSIIGAEAIDALIGGGLFDGSTTMVVGVSGIGKTILGVQLLLEGARQRGESGLLVSLDEHPQQIIRNAETLGLDLREQIDNGKIQVLFDSPQELEIDAHFHRITGIIERHHVKRLLIDGMTSYSSSLGSPQVYRDFFHALVAYAKRRLLTVFFNYENPELFGLSHYMPDYGVSSIVDNIVLMNLIELGDTLHRSITVAKARGCKHSFVTREFTVGQGGIQLLPESDSKLPALPFSSYYSLLRGWPGLKRTGPIG
jgi:circadian clock protein KaiC